MQMNDMILVSVDDHVCEPANMWDRHLPAKWKERAPRLVHNVIQKLCGHRDPRSTEVYAKLADQALVEAIRRPIGRRACHR